MFLEERVSGETIFWFTLIGKSRESDKQKQGKKKNDFPHYPFELPANQHRYCSPDWPNWLY